MSTWKKALSGITIGWMLGATMVVGLGTATAGGGCATDPRNDPFDISDTWNDTGTDSDDRWTSNGAQDTLNSQPCPDRNVDGGGENDEIHLGSQGDYGAGNAGRDEVFGGAGNDRCTAATVTTTSPIPRAMIRTSCTAMPTTITSTTRMAVEASTSTSSMADRTPTPACGTRSTSSPAAARRGVRQTPLARRCRTRDGVRRAAAQLGRAHRSEALLRPSRSLSRLGPTPRYSAHSSPVLVPGVGFEPTRLFRGRRFKAPSSTVPTPGQGP